MINITRYYTKSAIFFIYFFPLPAIKAVTRYFTVTVFPIILLIEPTLLIRDTTTAPHGTRDFTGAGS